MLKQLLRKILNIVLTVLVLIYLILDELIWERIAEPVYDYLHGLKVLHKVEIGILALNRYALLTLFLTLFASVEGLGVIAIGLFAQGLIVPGTLLYAGKIPIAAFTFWVFKIAKEKLLSFAWFEFCYEALMSFLHKIKDSEIYRSVAAKIVAIKSWIKPFWPSKTVQRIKALFKAKAPH